MSTRILLSAVVCGLTLTACGSGQNAQVYERRILGGSTNDTIGAIAVRNISVVAPASGTTLPVGSDADVTVTFVNEGGANDQLVNATSPVASEVRITGGPRLEVPGLTSTANEYGLRLVNLVQEVQTGSYVEMTLTFAANGSKTMLVPVQVAPGNVQREATDYQVAETDSAGKPIVEGGAPQQGDNQPDPVSDPKGDQAQAPSGQ